MAYKAQLFVTFWTFVSRVSVSEIVPLRDVSGLILFPDLGTRNGMCRGVMLGRVFNESQSQLPLFDGQAGVHKCFYGWLDRCKWSGNNSWTRVDISTSLCLQTYIKTLDWDCKQMSILSTSFPSPLILPPLGRVSRDFICSYRATISLVVQVFLCLQVFIHCFVIETGKKRLAILLRKYLKKVCFVFIITQARLWLILQSRDYNTFSKSYFVIITH